MGAAAPNDHPKEAHEGMASYRTEHDSLGNVEVPAEALYGAQTARAVRNFPISGLKAHPAFIRATAMVKRAAAEANMTLGVLDERRGGAIVEAAQEVIDGGHHEAFVVDVYQAGAGTSHNMNANEVIANLANERLGGKRGVYEPVHPNDHVNMAQSTNDSFPTEMRIAALMMVASMLPEVRALAGALEAKGREFDGILKSGRTHLQDAVPIRLGQTFAAYAGGLQRDAARIEATLDDVRELNLGATAAGTGLNSHPRYASEVAERLARVSGLALRPPVNMMERSQNMADFAALSGALRTLALTLIRIANDLRLLSSGPKTGLAEIRLPPVQPGSSIMPGKVNPVVAECMNMICFQVCGCDTTIAMATQAGQMELNVMMPVINHNTLHALEILRTGCKMFREFCVEGITADAERCAEWLENSMGLATVLNPYIGYEKAAKVVQAALSSGKTVRTVVKEQGILDERAMAEILDYRAMTEPRELPERAKPEGGG